MPLTKIHDIATDLRECRRYTETNPVHVTKWLSQIIDALNEQPSPRIERLVSNLQLARKYVQVDPEFTSAYLYASAFELECIKL